MKIRTDLYQGDAGIILQDIEDDSVDLIVTSPPYADQRKDTYGGISTDKYVEWFLPISQELLRVLKPSGTFVLNIKERVLNSERSAYVIELILEMRKQGWLWTEEFIWHKKNCYPGKWLLGYAKFSPYNIFISSVLFKGKNCLIYFITFLLYSGHL